MVRMGQSTPRAALIYQHSNDDRQHELAAKLDHRVRTGISRRQRTANPPHHRLCDPSP